MAYFAVKSASFPFSFTTASLASPIRCCTLPAFFSVFPSTFISRSLVALPTCSLIDPFTSWKLPLSLSFVLVFIFLLGRREVQIATLPNLFEAVLLVIPRRLSGLSRIEQLLSGFGLVPKRAKDARVAYWY